jgi:hypothetical protein
VELVVRVGWYWWLGWVELVVRVVVLFMPLSTLFQLYHGGGKHRSFASHSVKLYHIMLYLVHLA